MLKNIQHPAGRPHNKKRYFMPARDGVIRPAAPNYKATTKPSFASGKVEPIFKSRKMGRGKALTIHSAALQPFERTNFMGPKSNAGNVLRVYALGGLEEIGRNMTVIEYADNIIIIDMGLQFPEEDQYGVDYIIPNVASLKGKERNILGVILTHGHLDHIGAVPHLLPALGYPTLYGTKLTLAMAQKRLEEYQQTARPRLYPLEPGKDRIRLGVFEIELFRVSHSIPDACGVIVHTPEGIVVHTGDFKMDYYMSGERPADIARIAKLNTENVLALLMDSTNAGLAGKQLAESEIQHNLDSIIGDAKGRVIIGTFSSLLERVQQILVAAEKANRKVAIEGFSMKTNVEIAHQLGYVNIKKGLIVPIENLDDYPDNRVVLLCTGAQGEDNAAMARIINGEHRSFRIRPGDTVVFSSSVIPGNERSVQRLKDGLYRQGAEVIHYKMLDIHAGGHGMAEDLKLALSLIKPKYLIPFHGNHSFLHLNAKLAVSIGFPPQNILIADNGQVISFKNGVGTLTKEKLITDYVFVEGLSVGDISNSTMKDRQQLGEHGMVMIVLEVKGKSGELAKEPEVMTRGFSFPEVNGGMTDAIKKVVTETLGRHDPRVPAQGEVLKQELHHALRQLLTQKTGRQPMILPVVVLV